MCAVAFDEYGQPFIILRDQGRAKRLKGLDAHKANILAARTVAKILRSSLGPRYLAPSTFKRRSNAAEALTDRIWGL